MDGFAPDHDRRDRMLLYLLIGKNLDNVMEDWIADVGDGDLG